MPATYYAVLTTLGLQRLAEAAASYTPLVFEEMAVGDGDGSPITPNASMTALVNERARVNVNLVEVDPNNPNQVRVEGLIPAATGGFTIREAGIFNGDGEMIAVASYPPIAKPVPADGASVEEYIRILLVYENPSDAIELTVDTSVVMATRLYVDDEVAAEAAARTAADADLQDQVDELKHDFGCFADGSDGDVTLDGSVAAPAWASKSGSTYTVTRDFYCENLTLTGTAILDTDVYRAFVRDTITTSGGVVRCDGNDAANEIGGLGRTGHTVGGSADGCNGTNTTGGAGSNSSSSLGGSGGAGGAGLAGAGAGGTASGVNNNRVIRAYSAATLGSINTSNGGTVWYAGGAGGGAGGGGGSSNLGGGGGGGGGVLCLAARHIVLANASDIRAKGGAGGTGDATCGGGGGGGGGIVVVVYQTLSVAAGTFNAATCAPGGAGGARGAGGGTVDGTAGTVGSLFAVQLGVP